MSASGRKPKVLWVIPTVGSSFGGPTTTAVNGLIAETRAGLASELATTVSRSENPEEIPAVRRLEENGVPTMLFPRTGLIERGEAWGLSPKLAWWLLRNVRRYDVIHLQYVWCMTSIVGAVAARLSRVPLVITPHESLTDFDIDVASRRGSLRRLKLILRRLFLGTADRLVFMSEIERRDTRFGSTPAEIISHAVLEDPVPEPEPGDGADPEATPANGSLRIAFLGRNIEKKGIHLVVEAIGRHPDRDWNLTVVGPPGEEEYVRRTQARAAELGVDGQVDWRGFIDDRQTLFAESDVLVMPSVYEGFGMVAAEAMCAGLPVVVPRRSGVAELVSEYDAGVVMPESSVDELDHALTDFDDSPRSRSHCGRNGIRAANERLTYEAYAARTSALYGTLSGSGSAS